MQKTGWLIYNKEMAQINSGFISWFMSEAILLNIKLQLVIKEDLHYGITSDQLSMLHNGKAVSMPDFAIMRNNDPLLTKQLNGLGIKVFNNSLVSQISNHKGRTHQFLAGKGIPMLDTVFVSREEFCSDFDLLPFPYPVVIKEVAGRGGNQVYKAECHKELADILECVQAKELIIQRMGDVIGRDVRVFVIGGDIIAAILRSSDQDFRANFSLGGTAQLYELNEAQRSLVKKVIAAFNGELDFVGIDFLFAKDGSFIFNEIEDVAGSRTLSANSDVFIVRLYLEHILRSV
ncbi:ATP-grasp domain-containing protein [Bacillaceae bacterium IKA-2]|nr:ATP-grasp domain-containing protein [Bacillaceae bacterium IKA-2]